MLGMGDFSINWVAIKQDVMALPAILAVLLGLGLLIWLATRGRHRS